MASSRGTAVGRVVGICRYPVKSMMAEELNATVVTERGVLGDRAFALIDMETGKVASAKNPRRWPTCSCRLSKALSFCRSHSTSPTSWYSSCAYTAR